MNGSKTELPPTILVVDDDLINLRLLENFLMGRGYKVRPLRDGKMVSRLAHTNPPDLILLDIMMPDPDGYEVCYQLKADEKTRHIPVIFLSALDQVIDKVKGFSIGGSDYITKPFQPEEVIARIENQLQISRIQKQLIQQNARLQQEIQERRLMEEKLRSSQKKIRSFFEAMADLVLIVDADGNTIEIAPTNPTRLYPPETDILGQTVEELLSEPGEILRSHIRQALKTQQVVNCEYSLKVDKEPVWFSASIAPTSENTVAWVARDISDRKKAEDQLRLLLKTTQAISQSPDLDSALASILRLICQAIDWDYAEAWLPSKSRNVLELSWGWYGRTSSLEEFRRRSEEITFAPNQGLPGRVWASGKPEWIKDVSKTEKPIFLRPKIAAKVGLKAAFAMPVVADNQVLVVLVFFKQSSLVKNQRLLDLVEAIAAMVSELIRRKQAEIALRHSEERFRNLFENSPVAYQSLDEQGRYIEVNEELCDLLGYKREELLGRRFGEFWAPEIKHYFPKKFECFKCDGIVRAELYLMTKDGNPVTTLLEGRIQRDMENRFVRTHCILYNITDRKRAEEEIKAARERLELVLRASQDGFWDWDFLTGQIYFSPRYKEMLGYTNDEFPNQLSAWENVIFEEDRIAALKLIEDYNFGRLPQFLATQRFHHKNGSTVYILSRAIHLKDANGAIIRMIGAHTDITNLKQAEEALQKAVLAADAANRAKSDFLASMSHELRTPLNAILGFSKIMSRDKSLPAEPQKNIAIINRAGEHLLALIDDILEVSKIEAGRTNLNQSEFDFMQLIDGVKRLLQVKANSKGLQLNFEYSADIPQSVKADEGKLRQILLNLLGNAIKFTQVGSVMLRVSVSSPVSAIKTKKEEDEKLTIYFEVEDTGAGISPEEIHLLFEPFGQTETGRKSQQGTGLGLPISQKYVQLMGGEITVSSTPGKGSLFAFDIQVGLAKAESVQIVKPDRQVIHLAPHQTDYRILIVDDILESRLLLVKILSSIGFSIREVENGKDAVQSWKEWQPHLILMDMRMPIMNGYEATKQIRSEEQQRLNLQRRQGEDESSFIPPKTIVFALTASAFEEQRKEILSAGCDELIRKPFNPEVLLEKISEYLGVQYEWETKSTEAEDRRKNTENLTDADWLNLLGSMSPDWIAELYDAALQCSDDMVLRLIGQISANNPALANALRDLANNFQFEQIMQLAQKSRDYSQKKLEAI